MPIRTLLVLLLRAAFLGRQALVLKNLALRQQLVVLKRKRPHPRTTPADRRFWLVLRALQDGWRDCLHLDSPAKLPRRLPSWPRTNIGERQARRPASSAPAKFWACTVTSPLRAGRLRTGLVERSSAADAAYPEPALSPVTLRSAFRTTLATRARLADSRRRRQGAPPVQRQPIYWEPHS